MDYGIAVLSRVIDFVVLGNGDAREAGATPESIFPNLRHRFWYGDAREAGATPESTYKYFWIMILIILIILCVPFTLNLRFPFRYYKRSQLFLGKFLCNKCGSFCMCEAGAAIESIVANLRHRFWDADAREAGAPCESPVPNLRHRWGNGDARETGATIESLFPNLLHPFGKSDVREVLAIRESMAPNLRHRWGDGDAREALATRESRVPNLRHRWGDNGVHASSYQSITFRMDYGIAVLSRVIELVVLGNGDAREAGATPESMFPNLRHRWRDGDAREAGATLESTLPNLRHRWGDDGVHTSSYQSITFRMDYGIAILSRVIDLVAL